MLCRVASCFERNDRLLNLITLKGSTIGTKGGQQASSNIFIYIAPLDIDG